jgi:hypothetical protein
MKAFIALFMSWCSKLECLATEHFPPYQMFIGLYDNAYKDFTYSIDKCDTLGWMGKK